MSFSTEVIKREKLPKVYFDNLDALRTIACFSVFASHAMLNETLKGLWANDTYHRFINFFSTGGNGVSFFFVLSGFLITYLILQEEQQQGFRLKNFYVRRVLRIWPLYYFVVLFGFAIYPFLKGFMGIESNIPDLLTYHLLFLSNFDSIYIHHNDLVDLQPMMVGITWSVAIEEQFYLFWPLFFFFLPKYCYKYIPFFIIISCFIFRYIHQDDGAVMYYHTFSVMADLGLGGVCAYYALHSKRFISFWERLPRTVIIVGYVVGIGMLMYPDYLASSLHAFSPLSRFIITLFFAFIILEQNYSKYSLLKYKRLRYFSGWGKYTYSMYMLHPIGIQVAVVLYKVKDLDNTASFWLGICYVLIALVVSLIISYLSYWYYEKPFLKLKERFS
ncbi:MAG: acyltransferase family protein [Thermonemataceae bacterium]